MKKPYKVTWFEDRRCECQATVEAHNGREAIDLAQEGMGDHEETVKQTTIKNYTWCATRVLES